MSYMRFRNRKDAGRQLAAALAEYDAANPIVLGLPRGGVVVAAEVARSLRAPLDVVVARKIGAPHQPELAIGAIAPGGILVMDDRFAFDPVLVDAEIQAQRAEMKRRIARFRPSGSDLPKVAGRIVIIVDDGLATGLTAYAAVLAIRRMQPKKIVVALPVGSAEGTRMLREVADEVICLTAPDELFAIGTWYTDFDQVSDEEVESALKTNRGALIALEHK